MKTKLDEIVAYKHEELLAKKEKIPLEKLRSYVLNHSIHSRSFVDAVTHPRIGDIALIAEIKIASPTAGILGEEKDGIERAMLYEYGGADAISIVVDKKFFQGDPALIEHVKEEVSLPILSKDFVIEDYQIYEAKSVGADAVLLIVKILDFDQLVQFVTLVRTLGMEPVVEVNTEEEMEIALRTDARCIAVNARNLTDFSIDIAKASQVMKKIPAEKIVLGFSGIQSRREVEIYKEVGAKAVLVGTSLMKAEDVVKMIKNLKGIGVRV